MLIHLIKRATEYLHWEKAFLFNIDVNKKVSVFNDKLSAYLKILFHMKQSFVIIKILLVSLEVSSHC